MASSFSRKTLQSAGKRREALMSSQMTNYRGIFDKMKFAPYKFQEYPKKVGHGASRTTVNNRQEELNWSLNHGSVEAKKDPKTEQMEQRVIEQADELSLMRERMAQMEEEKQALAKRLAALEAPQAGAAVQGAGKPAMANPAPAKPKA